MARGEEREQHDVGDHTHDPDGAVAARLVGEVEPGSGQRLDREGNGGDEQDQRGGHRGSERVTEHERDGDGSGDGDPGGNDDDHGQRGAERPQERFGARLLGMLGEEHRANRPGQGIGDLGHGDGHHVEPGLQTAGQGQHQHLIDAPIGQGGSRAERRSGPEAEQLAAKSPTTADRFGAANGGPVQRHGDGEARNDAGGREERDERQAGIVGHEHDAGGHEPAEPRAHQDAGRSQVGPLGHHEAPHDVGDGEHGEKEGQRLEGEDRIGLVGEDEGRHHPGGHGQDGAERQRDRQRSPADLGRGASRPPVQRPGRRFEQPQWGNEAQDHEQGERGRQLPPRSGAEQARQQRCRGGHGDEDDEVGRRQDGGAACRLGHEGGFGVSDHRWPRSIRGRATVRPIGPRRR